MLFPAEIIDILKVLIILVCCYAMSYVDTSMLYHMIKSQSVIKLYLMYNMIEVADRLFRFVLKSRISCPFNPSFQFRFMQLFSFVSSNFSGSFYPTFQVLFIHLFRFVLSNFSGSWYPTFQVRCIQLFRFVLSNFSGSLYPTFQARFIQLFRFFLSNFSGLSSF